MQSMTSEEIKKQFEELLSFKSEEDKIELATKELVFSFLSEIDKAMERDNISKKELAKLIGTSASYITQLFRGDRTPNFWNIAKMKEALSLDFEIKLKESYFTKAKFHFPEVEQQGMWFFKSLKPDYDTPSSTKSNNVFYNEMVAA